MSASFEIQSAAGRYAIAIEPGIFEATLREDGERVYIADAFFNERLTDAGIDPIAIHADEHAKSLDSMAALIETMRERRVTRGTTVIAVGGGVIQDAAAFAASVYMRGVPWIYVPTTLLSMTDSCIGGKSSINVGRYKNIVGTFHAPRQVVIDPLLTRSLSAEQRIDGLCEAAKICFCRGLDTFDQYLSFAPSEHCDERALTSIIDLSLRTKKWFIEIDEFDRKERLVLNFGHTFGHAIEAASAFEVSHGTAVGLGMIAALRLGEALNRDYTGAPAIRRFADHIGSLLASVAGLGDALRKVRMDDLMDSFGSDKKHSRDQFAVIVVTEAGAVERLMVPRDAEMTSRIERAFAAVLGEYTDAGSALS